MGKAGAHQVPGARTALGHAYGGGSQFFSMWVVSSTPRLPMSVALYLKESVAAPHSLNSARGGGAEGVRGGR